MSSKQLDIKFPFLICTKKHRHGKNGPPKSDGAVRLHSKKNRKAREHMRTSKVSSQKIEVTHSMTELDALES